jgi:hypothetical protein
LNDFHWIFAVQDSLQLLRAEDPLLDILLDVDHVIHDIRIHRRWITVRNQSGIAHTLLALCLGDDDIVAILEFEQVLILPSNQLHDPPIDRERHSEQLRDSILGFLIECLAEPPTTGNHLLSGCDFLLVLTVLDRKLDVLTDRALFILAERLGAVDIALPILTHPVVLKDVDVEWFVSLQSRENPNSVLTFLEADPV